MSDLLTDLADTGRIPDSILVHGPKGSRRLERTFDFVCDVNSPEDPDREEAIRSGDDPDIHVVSPDGQSIGVDQIRGVLEEASKGPMVGPYRFVLIRRAHLLTYKASQALLKNTEESPDGVCIIVLTTAPGSLQKTLESRMLKVQVRETSAEISDHISPPDEQKAIMATRMGVGAVGRARALLDERPFGRLDGGLRPIRKQAVKLLLSTFRTAPNEYIEMVRDVDDDAALEELFRMYLALLFDVVLYLKGSEWLRNPDLEAIYEKATAETTKVPGVEFLEGTLTYWQRIRRGGTLDKQLIGLLTHVWRWQCDL